MFEEPRARFLNQAQRLIDRRGRGNYAEAATYLRKIRNLYENLGKQDDWQIQITSLRQENRALRALQDELIKAGL